MNYNVLGRSALKVSEIAFGCMSLENDFDTAEQLIRKAYDQGINFFDTADLYDKGLNEELVGTAIKPIRDKIILSTKGYEKIIQEAFDKIMCIDRQEALKRVTKTNECTTTMVTNFHPSMPSVSIAFLVSSIVFAYF